MFCLMTLLDLAQLFFGPLKDKRSTPINSAIACSMAIGDNIGSPRLFARVLPTIRARPLQIDRAELRGGVSERE